MTPINFETTLLNREGSEYHRGPPTFMTILSQESHYKEPVNIYIVVCTGRERVFMRSFLIIGSPPAKDESGLHGSVNYWMSGSRL